MKSFEEIYCVNKDILYKFIFKMCGNESLAEELAQETLFKAFVHIREFIGKSKISTWLCQIAKNEYFNYLKKNKRIVELSFGDLALYSSYDYYEVESKEQVQIILDIVNELPNIYKDVFLEKVIGALSYSDIATVHAKSESWARVTFYRAKQKINERIIAREKL